MSKPSLSTRNLAAAFLAGPWSADQLFDRGAQACGRRANWLRALARRVCTAFDNQPAPRPEVLAAFIAADRGWLRACANYKRKQLKSLLPALPTLATLAAWLGLTAAELDWFADYPGHAARVPAGPLRHYTYQWLSQRGGKVRLLEMPKHRLKTIQRRLLHEILDRIPPHEAAHGYRAGRSLVTYAAPHAAQKIIVRFDLRHFFPSIQSSRVHALFRTTGYPRAVARALTGVCTNVVPEEVWRASPGRDDRSADESARRRFSRRHLPQGAPTSPALANLCAYGLDCRLAGLAASVGGHYTRYADDLVFSGGERLERCARRFHVAVCRVALEEGFEVHTRKTHFMRQGVRQQAGGVVLNVRPNVRRQEFDRLKATLTNCVRHGPRGQDRDGHADFRGHLAGRVAYVAMLNPARGQKLRALFDRICWD